MSTETHTSERPIPPGARVSTVARYEGRNRVRIAVTISVLIALFGSMYLWLGPNIVAGDGFQDLLDAFPPALIALMGLESLQSLEGLLASEFYTFGWIVALGGYIGYSAAGSVAGDLSADRMDTLLAAPVSRWSVLLGKYIALFVPIAIVNVLVPATLYAGSVAVGEPLALERLVVLHLLSVPYLMVWGSVGLFLGVVVGAGRTAGRATLGLVFASWIVESVLRPTEYEWIGAVSPMRYFDPPAVMIHAEYDITGAVGLLVAAILLVLVSLVWFARRDL